MKNLTLLFAAILLSLATVAQAPMGINYQTVIRDGDGNILPDTELSLQMTIRSGAPDGAVVYAETHEATTNAFGLVNLVIGSGAVQSGAFADINWGADAHYFETAIDLADSKEFQVMGITQFLSVPYAIFSQKAAALKDGVNPGEMLYWNGEEWIIIEPGLHDQTLRLCYGVPTWGPCLFDLDLISDPLDGGTVDGSGIYETEEQVFLKAIPNPGWEFVKWTDDNGVLLSTQSSFYYSMPPNDIALTATFIEEQAGFVCGLSTIADIDGNVYTTVLLGNQCWFGENLNTTRDANGNNIDRKCQQVIPNYCEIYGGLYTWNTLMNGQSSSDLNPSGVQGICPTGWHIPSKSQWKQLLIYSASQGYPNGLNSLGAGNALKSCRQIDSPLGGDCNTSEHPYWQAHWKHSGFDAFGFSALPAGKHTHGTDQHLNKYSFWWQTTEMSSNSAYSTNITYNVGAVNTTTGNFKTVHKSVRCLKVIDPQLHLNVAPDGAASVTGAGQYLAGEQVSISVVENDGWEFVSWINEDGIVSQVADFTYTMSMLDATLTAIFTSAQSNFSCEEPIADVDGNFYNTVQIGDQCWMAENLKTTNYKNGTPIEYPGSDNNAWSNDTAGAYAWYSNSIEWKDICGALYNWNAVINTNGLCPNGWKIPSDDELKILEGTVDSQYPVGDPEWDITGQRGLDAGGNLKEAGTTHWNSPNTGATNSSGFTALPGGYRKTSGSFSGQGSYGFWWSSSAIDASNAWYRYLGHNFAKVDRNNSSKSYGYSVRCIKGIYLSLLLNNAEAGTVSGAGQYLEDDQVNISAEANEGWYFVNWTDEENLEVSTVPIFVFVMPDDNVILTANFESIPTYSLNLEVNPNDAGIASGAGQHFEGKQVSVSVEANNGWGFVNWMDDNNLEVSTDASFIYSMPAGEATLTANFESLPTYSLNLEVNPNDAGIVSGTGLYFKDDQVNITAEANVGWYFVKWTDEENLEVSANASFVYTMPDNDATLTANFEPIYSLNIEVNPTGAGTVSGAGQYLQGEQVNITAEINEGWNFVNWTDEENLEVSVDDSFVYTMPDNEVTLTAYFVLIPYGDPLIDSRDGQTYNTVQIGEQCWMAENLAYLPEVSPSSQGYWDYPFYYVYNYQGSDVTVAKATINYQTYGVLYNWPASLDACPEGWHLPSDTEWTVLTDYLGGEDVAGGKMKETGTAHWNFPNTGATNSSGFTALPGGWREDGWAFCYVGYNVGFWSSTESSTSGAWYRDLRYNNGSAIRGASSMDFGFSVRCVRDLQTILLFYYFHPKLL